MRGTVKFEDGKVWNGHTINGGVMLNCGCHVYDDMSVSSCKFCRYSKRGNPIEITRIWEKENENYKKN